MRSSLAALAFVLMVAVMSIAPFGRPSAALTASYPVHASAVDFWRNYSDPASDVVRLYGTNLTPVVVSGALVMSPFPDSVNILWLRSGVTPDNQNATVSVEVKGSIANLPNTTYEARLYTRSDNRTHFIVDYSNGSTTFRANTTDSLVTNITGNSSVASTGPNPVLMNTLRINVSMALLGNVTSWNLDATATQLGSPYSYRDFGWDLPGNPGSTPTQVVGVVTDVSTGNPLAGVNVSAGPGIYITTNATGAYVLPVEAGTYNVTFSLSGYYAATRQATVVFGATTTLNVGLQKLSFVESLGIWLWLLLGVALAVVVGLVVLVARRRKPSPPGK